MWNPKKSALLSLAFVYFFIVILVVLEIFAPWITKSYLEITGKSLELQPALLVFVYACFLPLGYALWLLLCFLGEIRRGRCFCESNVTRLRRLSWCCFALVPIALTLGIRYLPILLLVPAAAFIGLVLRVIKNAFQAALELQTENEMTI